MKAQDFYFEAGFIEKTVGIGQHILSSVVLNNPECQATSDGYPVFALMRVFYNAYRKLHSAQSMKHTGDDDVLEVQINMQREKLMKERIFNQTKLGMLILKSEASERTLRFAQAINSTVKNSIQLTADKLVGHEGFANKREAEIFLTENYNKAVNFLENNVELLEWEHDGDAYLMQTRLERIEQIDKQTQDVVDELNED